MPINLSGYTQLIGQLAYPIRHSSSPALHNEAFSRLGLDYVYLAFEVDNGELADAVKGLRAMKVRGFNVSMPNKTVIHKYLDRLSPAAELCGAVNTVVNDDGVLTGHITGGIGFMSALKDKYIDIIGEKMVIAGAGGAATAIQIQAALDGVAEIAIFNARDAYWERAEATVRKIAENTSCKATLHDLADMNALRRELEDSCILVNATSMGMKPLEGQTFLTDRSLLREDLIVVDVVYAPPETALLKMARTAGCQSMNGLGMMLFQGAAAFKLWMGQDMPIEYMKVRLGIQGNL